MRNNRHLEVKLAKDEKTDTKEPRVRRTLTEPEIDLIKTAARGAAKFTIAMVLICKFSEAACEIAVNASPKKH